MSDIGKTLVRLMVQNAILESDNDSLRADNEAMTKIIRDKKFDAVHLAEVLDYCPVCQIKKLREKLREQAYLVFAAKLAFMPENAPDFSDDEFSRVILERLKTNT